MIVPATDQIREIESLRAELNKLRASLVGDDLVDRLPWRLSQVERRIFGMLLASDIVAKRTIVLVIHGREASAADLKNLDVFIGRIRSKSAEHGVKIETIFGVGYRLEGRLGWRRALAKHKSS